MRKLIAVVAALASALVIGIVPAGAITNGVPDGNGHPYVGLMVAIGDRTLPSGEVVQNTPLWRCSGTLMSPTVYMTAGHCTEPPAERVEIFFSAGPIPTDPDYLAAVLADPDGVVSCDASPLFDGYPCEGDVGGTPHTHPLYDPDAFFLHDLGVVVLDESVQMATYGELPTLGQVSALPKHASMTAVGYGLQRSFPEPAAWKNEAVRIRLVAHPRIMGIDNKQVGDFAFFLSHDASRGGTCFGDSGGPVFIGDTNVVAGVTSFGQTFTCHGHNGAYRVDQPDDLAWLATFGLTPG